MKIIHKITAGFALIALLVGAIGYFGISAGNDIQRNFTLGLEVNSSALKVAEKGMVTFAATFTQELGELEILQEKFNRLDKEINASLSELLEEPNLKDNSNLQIFVELVNKHNKDQKQIFEIHKELLTRESIFGESPLVEEGVRERMEVLISQVGDVELIESLGRVKTHAQQALFRNQKQAQVDEWLKAIHELRVDVIRSVGPHRDILNRLDAYLQTVEIVGSIAVREKEIRTEEAQIITDLRKRELDIAELRRDIVDDLFTATLASSQTSRNVLLVSVVAILVLVVGIAFSVIRAVSLPIKNLTQSAQEIAAGNLRRRAEVTSEDEIGQLATSFNKMADHLAAYPLKLEAEVAARTKQLNKLLKESYMSSKLLVRKDRQLTKINQDITKLNNEMVEVGRVLVKRDLELSEANMRLEELDETKSEFVSVAAHQLRTPLTGIRWSIKGLLDGEFGTITAEQQRILTSGLQVAISAIELINNLLDIAHIESGKFGYDFKKGDLADLVRLVVTSFKKHCADKGITLSIKDIPDTLPATFDEEKMKMVLDNLTDNAVKYTNPGGAITFSVYNKKDGIVIVIADTGIGIPEHEHRRLFSKFFRAPNALLLRTSGTGLGLYLVKNIIEEHKGSISFESVEGEGTTFTIKIPHTPISKKEKSV